MLGAMAALRQFHLFFPLDRLIENKAGYTAVRCVPRRDRHICTRTIPAPLITPCPAPHPSFLPLPPLDIPSSSEVEFTRFRAFEK